MTPSSRSETGSGCGGVGGMDGDAATPGGLERTGHQDITPGKTYGKTSLKTLRQRKEMDEMEKKHAGFQAGKLTMSTSSTPNGALVNHSRFFFLYGWLGTFEPGRGMEAE